jgi:nondiscriminating aspartyl-tRNA synthetase
VDDHTDVMAVVERVIGGMLAAIAERARADMTLLGVERPLVPARLPSIDFTQAQKLIQAATGEDVLGEPDLAPVHERWLGEWAAREHASDFLFVTGFPMSKRPFYTHPRPEDPERSNSFDLLFRGLEVVTGGQRLHRHADYVRALAERGQEPEPLGGYLEAFKHGMPPHGGFAMGLERWVGRLIGAGNVREVTLFPRDVQRLTP